MSKNQMNGNVVFVRCLTEKATIIGKRNYQPQNAPVEITEKEYESAKLKYDFYEGNGTLSIERAGSKGFALAARKAKAAQRIAEETDAQGEMPPASIEIPTLGIPGPIRDEIAKSRTRRAGIDAVCCKAKRADGLQCRSKPRIGYDFCGFHSKMVVNGKEVEDMNGNIVKLEDVE